MRAVFADSFFFFALLNPRDPTHVRAVAFTGVYTGGIVTTGRIRRRDFTCLAASAVA